MTTNPNTFTGTDSERIQATDHLQPSPTLQATGHLVWPDAVAKANRDTA